MVWLGEGQNFFRKDNRFKRDWTASKIINCSTLNSECNWKDLCIQLKDQQLFSLKIRTRSGEVQFANLWMVYPRFANATQI